MIKIEKQIDTSNLLKWLETLKPCLTSDVSNYAVGRQRLWLKVEPPLGNQPYKPGFPINDKIWERLQEIIEWKFDYCLVTYSGDDAIGIRPHRDSSYADYEAMGLNISGTCKFSYWNSRKSFGFSKSTEPNEFIVLDLKPGDLIRFNCKNLHSAEPSPDRWNMNFWKKKVS